MKYILSGLLFVFLFSSCEDLLEMPNIDTQVDKMTVRAGEPVKFTFSPESDFITFYSGEAGKQYSQKDAIYAEGSLQLSFDSKGEWGGNPALMSLHLSKDFIGVDSIAKVNWQLTEFTTQKTDSLSTDSLKLSEAEIESQLVILLASFSSENNYKTEREYFDEATWKQIPDVQFGPDMGALLNEIVDLAPYASSDATKVTLAFRNYNSDMTYGDFYINNYKVQVISDAFEGAKDFRSIGDGWLNISVSNENRYWRAWANGFRCVGSHVWVSGNPMDTWGLMYPLDLTQTDFPIPGDNGVNIKQYYDSVPEYEYVYTEAGTYDATFIYTDVDDKGNSKTSIKTIQVQVTE